MTWARYLHLNPDASDVGSFAGRLVELSNGAAKPN